MKRAPSCHESVAYWAPELFSSRAGLHFPATIDLSQVKMSGTLIQQGDSVCLGAAPGITVRETRFAPSIRIDEHDHAWGYLCITLAGSVHDTIGGRNAEAAPGYSCFVPPGTPHANAFGPRGARCLMFELSSDAMSQLRSGPIDVSHAWSRLGGSTAWRGLALYRQLRHQCFTTLDVEQFVFGTFDGPRTSTERTRAPRWLRRVKEMLDADLRRPPSISALAAEANLHQTYFLRIFRLHAGCTPGAYVQTRRIAVACGLLLDTTIPLAQVADHVGFYDQPHFSRVFKARIGVPPAAYRTLKNLTS